MSEPTVGEVLLHTPTGRKVEVVAGPFPSGLVVVRVPPGRVGSEGGAYVKDLVPEAEAPPPPDAATRASLPEESALERLKREERARTHEGDPTPLQARLRSIGTRLGPEVLTALLLVHAPGSGWQGPERVAIARQVKGLLAERAVGVLEELS